MMNQMKKFAQKANQALPFLDDMMIYGSKAHQMMSMVQWIPGVGPLVRSLQLGLQAAATIIFAIEVMNIAVEVI